MTAPPVVVLGEVGDKIGGGEVGGFGPVVAPVYEQAVGQGKEKELTPASLKTPRRKDD
jgi:hypothetical protein